MPKDISIKELLQKFSKAEEGWETVVDFTDGGKKAGVPVEDVIKMIKKMRR